MSLREAISGRGKLRRTELGEVVCEADYDIVFVSDVVLGKSHQIQFPERAEAKVRPTQADLSDGIYWLETAPGDDHQFLRLSKKQSTWTVTLTS